MGSLVRDQRWLLMEKPSPPSPLVPFQQRQNNRSPLESPPIAKKLPKVKEGDLFFGQAFINVPHQQSLVASSSFGAASAQGKENRSILKKPESARNRTPRSLRRVEFERDVTVYRFDRAEGGHVCSESQTLSSSDTKDRKEFVNRTLQGRNRQMVVDSRSPKMSIFGGSREPPILYAEPLPAVASQYDSVTSRYSESHPVTSSAYDLPSSSLPSTSSSCSSVPVSMLDQRTPLMVQGPLATENGLGLAPEEVDFSFFEDDHHRLRLKFTIPLGDGVAANDVLVKANTAGNKVRLVGTRTVRSPRQGTVRQEFTERYQLPMEVDPYLIAARMDNSGNLYVEAPIMTADRKRALAAERQTIVDDPRIGALSDFVL